MLETFLCNTLFMLCKCNTKQKLPRQFYKKFSEGTQNQHCSMQKLCINITVSSYYQAFVPNIFKILPNYFERDGTGGRAE